METNPFTPTREDESSLTWEAKIRLPNEDSNQNESSLVVALEIDTSSGDDLEQHTGSATLYLEIQTKTGPVRAELNPYDLPPSTIATIVTAS